MWVSTCHPDACPLYRGGRYIFACSQQFPTVTTRVLLTVKVSGWGRRCITWDVPCLDRCIGRPGMALCLRVQKGMLPNPTDFCLGITENRGFFERKLLTTVVLLFFHPTDSQFKTLILIGLDCLVLV